MQKLLNSILRNGTLLLFIFLLGVSVLYISKSQSYQRSRFLSFTHSIAVSVFEVRNQLFSYFKHRSHNQLLIEENRYLLTQLIKEHNQPFVLDSLPFEAIAGQVIRNSIQLNHNYITLNIGENDGVKKEMGIITAKGVVGIVYDTNEKTCGVISILNKSLKINAKLKKSHHFGSLYWDGLSPDTMILSDVPLAANVKVGDTIVTGGMSAVFPAGIELGSVKEVAVPINDNYFTLYVSLFQDVSNLNHVYAVNLPASETIKEMIIENE